MRVVLADLKSNRGFVSKDTVVGGYGSRLDPFSRVTTVMAYLKQQFHDVPSVHMAYIAAILARAGHEVSWTRGEMVDGDVALVLSSLVDHKNETAWADGMRARGVKVGFIGITASKMPELFADHCDFILNGEPEAAVMRLAQGEIAQRDGHQRADQRSRFAAVSAVGSGHRGSPQARGQVVHRGRSAAAIRCSPAAAARSSARIARTGSSRAIARVRSRTSRTSWSGCATSIRGRTSSSAIRCSANSGSGVSSCATRSAARGLTLTFEAETRLDRLDTDLLESAVRRRLPRDELRRGVARPGDAQEVRAPADSAGAPARRSWNTAASWASSRRRSTCSGSCRTTGTRSRPRSTTPPISGRRSRSSRC